MEWEACVKYIEGSHPLAICMDDTDNLSFEDYLENNQMDGIESAYMQCHEYLSNMLNHEVYLNKRTFRMLNILFINLTAYIINNI